MARSSGEEREERSGSEEERIEELSPEAILARSFSIEPAILLAGEKADVSKAITVGYWDW